MPDVAPHTKLWLGIICLVLGQWTLSLLDAAGKLLAQSGYHVVMIAWMRYSLNTVLMAAILAPIFYRQHGYGILRSQRPALQLFRAALMLLSTIVFFSVLKIAPLSEGTAMNFCAPLFVLAVSPWLLKEKSYASRWIAVAVGFTGMLIVMRPGGSIPPAGVFLGLASAVIFSAVVVLTRKTNQYDHPMVTLFYGGLVGMVISSAIVPFFWTAHMPTVREWLILGSTGITSTVGHLLVNSAYKHAEASLLAPYSYLQIISATTMGWLVFDQLPDGLTAIGIAIICTGGMGIAYIEHRRVQADAPGTSAAQGSGQLTSGDRDRTPAACSD